MFFEFLQTQISLFIVFTERRSDNQLRFFRSLIFTRRFHYGMIHLFIAFFYNPFFVVRFFVIRFFARLSPVIKFTESRSDNHLFLSRSLVFTRRWHNGAKHLLIAFCYNPFFVIKFFLIRFCVHSFYKIRALYRKLGF